MRRVCGKPFAETMDDANFALKAAKETKKVIQVGSQRRSGTNYQAAYDYIKSGKFGKIIAVEMTWNVNQPGRWRLPQLTKEIREQDTDWKRFLMNRPYEPWDPRKYLGISSFLALLFRHTGTMDGTPDRHGTLVLRSGISPVGCSQMETFTCGTTEEPTTIQ